MLFPPLLPPAAEAVILLERLLGEVAEPGLGEAQTFGPSSKPSVNSRSLHGSGATPALAHDEPAAHDPGQGVEPAALAGL